MTNRNIQLIRDNVEPTRNAFNLQEENECKVKKLIENLNLNEGPGYEMHPPTIDKSGVCWMYLTIDNTYKSIRKIVSFFPRDLSCKNWREIGA